MLSIARILEEHRKGDTGKALGMMLTDGMANRDTMAPHETSVLDMVQAYIYAQYLREGNQPLPGLQFPWLAINDKLQLPWRRWRPVWQSGLLAFIVRGSLVLDGYRSPKD